MLKFRYGRRSSCTPSHLSFEVLSCLGVEEQTLQARPRTHMPFAHVHMHAAVQSACCLVWCVSKRGEAHMSSPQSRKAPLRLRPRKYEGAPRKRRAGDFGRRAQIQPKPGGQRVVSESRVLIKRCEKNCMLGSSRLGVNSRTLIETVVKK